MPLTLAAAVGTPDLERARDKQDQAALARYAAEINQSLPVKQGNPDANYKLALAYSYAAEVAMEGKDKAKAKDLAVAGIDAATKAVKARGGNAEYHRLLGQLCGQVIPANIFLGMQYGKCARDEVNRAIELDAKSALAYVSRGVGNYYLPEQLGGGITLALKDFDNAISLNPKLAEAFLWKGIALRKANKNVEARKALQQALQLNPHRIWAKQQLDKTPAQ